MKDPTGSEPGRTIVALGKETATDIGATLFGDPTVSGATLRVIATGTTASDETYLLDASGFRDRELPSLRYLTQAGGRMPPERVREYAALGRARGWDLFVMYGQTEATARMAYLPPDLAAQRPEAIGVPIPGGSFRLERPAALTEAAPDVGGRQP